MDAVAVVNGRPLGFEVKWRRSPPEGRKPFKTLTLDRDSIPVFLATLKTG